MILVFLTDCTWRANLFYSQEVKVHTTDVVKHSDHIEESNQETRYFIAYCNSQCLAHQRYILFSVDSK